MKTSELSGPALDWAVVLAQGIESPDYWLELYIDLDRAHMCSKPSVDWRSAGPIIEREGIHIRRGNSLYFPQGNENGDYYEPLWLASIGNGRVFHGQTLMVAAMRCYVASKFGDEIEVPETLRQLWMVAHPVCGHNSFIVHSI